MILLSGVAIVCASILLIIRDNKKSNELLKIAKTEKNELQSIIDDAELMVDELNNFSDYIITQIERKNSEVDRQLTKLDEKLKRAMETQAHPDIPDERVAGIRYTEATEGTPESEDRSGDTRGDSDSDTFKDSRENSRGDRIVADKEEAPETDWNGEPDDGSYAEVSVAETAPRKKKSVFRLERLKKDKEVVDEQRQPYDIKMIRERVNAGSVNRTATLTINDKKYGNVLKYAEEGMVVAEIAKKLNIGSGEVELIIGLKSYYEKN